MIPVGLMVDDDGRFITLHIGSYSYTMPPFLAREVAASLLNRADIIEPLPEQDGWQDS